MAAVQLLQLQHCWLQMGLKGLSASCPSVGGLGEPHRPLCVKKAFENYCKKRSMIAKPEVDRTF